jgi:hypothetical protein
MKHELDPDKWSVVEALGILGELGYKRDELEFDDRLRLWWKGAKSTFEDGLKPLNNDRDAAELVSFAYANKCVVEIYVEHPPSVISIGVNEEVESAGVNKGKGISNEVDVEVDVEVEAEDGDEDEGSSEESVGGIYLEETEEERDLGDDGFGLDGVGEAEAALNATVEAMKKNIMFVAEAEPDNVSTALVESEQLMGNNNTEHGGYFLTDDELEKHNIEDGYSTEELDSYEDESDCDDLPKPKIDKFNKEDMCKSFKFRVGMEFNSLQEFKEAILEHSVLIGRQVKFVKNDATRVRVICKQKCNFVAFVSRVGKSTTYKMKTLKGKHTCGRV